MLPVLSMLVSSSVHGGMDIHFSKTGDTALVIVFKVGASI
jgi:hypothetical protein